MPDSTSLDDVLEQQDVDELLRLLDAAADVDELTSGGVPPQTRDFRVFVVQLNVVGGVHARPDADRCADDERYGLSFLFGRSLL